MGWDWDYAAPPTPTPAEIAPPPLADVALAPAEKAVNAEHLKDEQLKDCRNEISSSGDHPAARALVAPAPADRLRRGQRAVCPCTGDVLAVERGGRQPLLRAQDGALHVCPAATLARAAAGRPRRGSGSVAVLLSVSREELARWRERPEVRAHGFSVAVRDVLGRTWA